MDTCSSTDDKPLTQDEVFNLLKPHSCDWFSIGRFMRVPLNIRMGIHRQSFDIDDKLELTIGHWFRLSKTTVTWRKLTRVLEKLCYEDVIQTMKTSDEWKEEEDGAEMSERIFSQSGVPCAFFPKSCGCNHCTVRGWRTKRHCQSGFPESRPKILVINPAYRDPQVKQLVQFESDYDRQFRLCSETSRITQEFNRLKENTWRLLEQGVTQQKLSISDFEFECTVKLNKSFREISSCNSLSNFLHDLGTSWFNFTLLLHLAEKFLSDQVDLITDWKNYAEHFIDYCSHRNLSEYTNVFFKTTNSKHIFLIEVDELYYDFTLNDVIQLQKTLSKVLEVPFVSLHLVTVGKASLIIYFHYCLSDYLKVFSSLTQEQLEMISKSYNIVSISDLHNHFKYEDIHQLYGTVSTSSELEQTDGRGKKSKDFKCKFQKFIESSRATYYSAVCANGDIWTTVQSTHSVLLLNKEGRQQRSIGGIFNFPHGVAISHDRQHILVSDEHQLQKLKFNGTCIKKLGSREAGSSLCHLNTPRGIAVHPKTGQIFIADSGNNRVQVLNADLTFSHSVPEIFNTPFDISLHGQYMYVSEWGGSCITKLTISNGNTIARFKSNPSYQPSALTVNDDLIYIVEWDCTHSSAFAKDCVCVLTTNGEFIGYVGDNEVTRPQSVALDQLGNLYINDNSNRTGIAVYGVPTAGSGLLVL